MKKTLKVTALSLGLAFASSFAMAAENIAFINAGYLFQNHPARAEIEKKMEKEFKAPAEQLANNKKKIEGKIAALQKDAKELRSAEIKKREDEINKLAKEHEQKAAKFQEEVARTEELEAGKLIQSIQDTTNEIAKQKGYSLVLDAKSVVFSTEGKDITEDVLKALGGTTETSKEASKAEEPAKTK